MQNVNLLDRRFLPQEPLFKSAAAMAVLAAAALAVVGHGLFEQERTRGALAALAQSSAAAAPAAQGASTGIGTGEAAATTAAQAGELSRLRAQLAAREALLAALKSEPAMPAAPSQTLRQITFALPATMWLTEIELHGARELRIAGGTLDPLALAEFARRLAQAETLRGVGLQTVRLEPETAEPGADSASTAAPTHTFVLASQAEAAGTPR